MDKVCFECEHVVYCKFYEHFLGNTATPFTAMVGTDAGKQGLFNSKLQKLIGGLCKWYEHKI